MGFWDQLRSLLFLGAIFRMCGNASQPGLQQQEAGYAPGVYKHG